MRYDKMREKERVLKEFFATFDTSVLVKHRRLQWRLRRARGEPSFGPNEVKEDPTEELPLDMENHRYTFYYHPNA